MEKSTKNSTQIGLHSVSNLLGSPSQLSLFSEHDTEFSHKYGLHLEGTINRFGVDLTDMQSRIMEGILRGFTETSYKGNIASKKPQEIANERYNGEIPDSYKNLTEIPRLKISQAKILEWSGLSGGGISSWARALKALEDLGTTQFCFYYDRLAYDENGIPIKLNKTAWKKEEVYAVDTLFTIKEIRNDKRVEYYEITPSAIFLDQRESYFMMVPFGWREEVKQIFGNKKTSSYTFRFLLFLRYQYEMKRRSKKQKGPYSIKWSPKEIAEAIKMPESIFNRKPKRMNEILSDAYSVAKHLGYLTSYERTGCLDILKLNDSKYFGGSEKTLLSKQNSPTISNNSEAALILTHYQNCRKKLDPKYMLTSEKLTNSYLSEFQQLLKERTKDEIINLISWSIKSDFWFSRLSSPSKIRQNFSEALSSFKLKQVSDPKTRIAANITIAKALFKRVIKKPDSLNIEMLSKYIEFNYGGVGGYDTLEYSKNNFEESLHTLFKKYRVEISEKN